jgi:hypothetical protein
MKGVFDNERPPFGIQVVFFKKTDRPNNILRHGQQDAPCEMASPSGTRFGRESLMKIDDNERSHSPNTSLAVKDLKNNRPRNNAFLGRNFKLVIQGREFRKNL